MNRFRGGFSLVEIMVGLAMGMIAMLIILQVFSVFEGGKRTTTGAADAQSNGAIALYMIERDARMAGWGIGSAAYSGCDTTFSYCDGSASCGGGTGALNGLFLGAVRITDGGANPDSITAQFFANPNLDTFRYPSTTTLRSTMPQPSAELNVTSVSGCSIGGMVLVSQDGMCTLMRITQVQGAALKIQHNPGASGDFNPPVNIQNDPANPWPAYTEGASLSCFNAAPNGPLFQRSYSVNTTARQLQRTDNSVSPIIANESIAPEVFDLQAQYGVAPSGSQVVDTWVDATAASGWANPSQANQNRIKAIRIALVVRSTQYEKPESGACQTTTSTDDWSSWATFSTENYPGDWKCYRYKVFETVAPLRNTIWANL